MAQNQWLRIFVNVPFHFGADTGRGCALILGRVACLTAVKRKWNALPPSLTQVLLESQYSTVVDSRNAALSRYTCSSEGNLANEDSWSI